MQHVTYPPRGFPERLAIAIGAAGIPVIEICRRSGVSKSSLYNYMSGDMSPTLTAAVKLAAVLNVSLEWLAQGKGNR